MATAPVTVDIEIDTSRTHEILARAHLRVHLLSCEVCAFYYRRRGVTLLVPVAGVALNRGTGFAVELDRFIQGVHDRHLAGESLSTRHHTPVRRTSRRSSVIRVQRSCNGCQKDLGDTNEAELDAAVAGRPLPDVRLECGCWTEAAA